MLYESEGLKIARERIAKEREERTGFLDLGRLGLQNWPEELWELEHLIELNLGRGWYKNGDWRKAESDLGQNQPTPKETRWSSFPNLRHLHICGMTWEDLIPLQGLASLQSLDCSRNQMTTLEPLAGLSSLHSLNCSGNGLATLEPLAGLSALQSLDCSHNRLTTLEPLAGLAFLQSLVCHSNRLATLEPLAVLTSLWSLDCSGNGLATLEPLAGLPSLRFLICSVNGLMTLEPLAGLASLQSLDCSGNALTTVEPLAGITSLRSLDCSGNGLTTLEPLAGLISLQSLDCSGNALTTVEPLAGITSLRSLDCSGNGLTTLEPLAGLASLQSLKCSHNRLATLEPLAGLSSLQSLDCSENELTALEPLAGLSALQFLDCSSNRLMTLEPLAGLASLPSLKCSGNRLTALEPLAGLASLQSLKCSHNQLTTLEPLAGLASLQSLNCWNNPVERLPEKLVWQESLLTLIIPSAVLDSIPVETLSRSHDDNCLERLRAHFRDLKAGEALLPDVKVMILGNGRIGKTQLCNRLRGLPFEENADSTHGITVASQKFGPDTLLRFWDFGGQDIYHGTHALFMRDRAIFVLVWTPDSENSAAHEHGGMIFRNRPLAWWLSYVRHLAGPESPVLLVQNRCDRAEDRILWPPVGPEELEAFPFFQALQYSALNQKGGKVLRGALEEVVDQLRERQGQARIGRGRMKVKARLDALLLEDAAVTDSSKRRHRTLPMERYEEICVECGGVSSPALLLDYLHRSGMVFYKSGLFGGCIILDQGWALEAVYTVFNRDKCFRELRRLHGRMTRTLLEALAWHEHSEDEQKLFLDFMLSCGICFVHRRENEKLGFETEYIAPDLLPDYETLTQETKDRWREGLPGDEAVVELPFAHPGVMRALLIRIGNLAGMTPVYWRDGVCLYESTHGSYARIEQRLEERPPVIVIRTREGESLSLLMELAQWVRETAELSGLTEVRVRLPEGSDTKSRNVAESAIPDRQSSPSLIFDAMPPTGTTTCAVSYAWRDKSHETVDRLCREAEARGIRIIRDVTDVGLGEKLSRFMTSLAGQDRVFVILSDAYLHSENCMFELSEIWRLSQQNDTKFHERVRVFRLPDARIYDMGYQLDIIEHWEQEYQKVHARVTPLTGRGTLSEAMLRRFNNLKAFAQRAGEIVPGIADRLLPKDFEQFAAHGFTDNSSTPSSISAGTESSSTAPASHSPSRTPMNEKQKILFLAANPTDTARLALDVECRDIEAGIQAAALRDHLELHTKFAVRPKDLLHHLQRYTPHIVHFSGHGSPDEAIVLLGSDEKAKPVSTAALTQVFTTLRDNIRVVVFNACFSRDQAEAVTSVIDCAVGMRRAIGDKAAITFAAAFYESIAFGRSIKTAFEAGKAAIMLEGISEENTPVLLTRSGVDPAKIVLIDPNPT
ncbi:MAG: hypothetical protein JWM59_2587 [Verrucomicrobiales bacterium]|nr:hypothetical protein [Verrucomicrobiales bacterium]